MNNKEMLKQYKPSWFTRIINCVSNLPLHPDTYLEHMIEDFLHYRENPSANIVSEAWFIKREIEKRAKKKIKFYKKMGIENG